MNLIPNWKAAYKFWSARLAGATAVLAGMDWLIPSLVGTIPKWAYFALAIAICLARIVQQKETAHADTDPKP